MTGTDTLIDLGVLRILVVDDEPQARNDVCEALECELLTFEACESAAKLLSRLEADAVDVVVLDLDLGDRILQVPEIFSDIKAKWPKAILLVLSDTVVLQCNRKGADAYIPKPQFYADRMVLVRALLDAMERGVGRGVMDRDLVDRIRRELPEDIVTLRGYVHDIREDDVEVVVDEKGPDGTRQPKTLVMDAEMFERKGLLLEDMPFVFRLYWQGEKMISELLPDERPVGKPVPEIEEMLKKVKATNRKEAGRNRDGGKGA